MPTDSGYSNQKKKGTAQFETVHPLGSAAYGKSSSNKALYEITAAAAIVSVTDILGSNGQVEFWKIELTSHGASVGNILRITSGALINFEFDVMSIVNANNFYILPISDVKPAAAMTATVMGWVTQKVSSDGSTSVAITVPPTSYEYNGSPQVVTQDTTTAVNNRALPNLAFFYENTVQTPVFKDTVTPANSKPLPVEIIAGSSSEVLLEGFVDPNNSSTTPLGIGGVFTGTAFNITSYAAINVNVKSDVASATNGVKVEFSTDGTNWDHSHSTNYTAATGVGYIFNAEFKFARVVYTNGASAQGIFRLQTIFKTTKVQSSLYTLDQTVTGNMFAELNKSTIIGKTTGGGGGFVDVKVNPSGALTTETQLTASTANIGDVDVLTLPVTYGAGNTDAATQRVVIATNQAAISVNPVAGNLVPVAYNELVISYVGATTDISTVVYKQATVTVATLTLSYDGSNRLIGVVRT
jgi:hypothetical protein